MKSYFLPLSLATLLGSSVFAVDENGNGLSDVWEQHFNASALELLDDDDGDGFSNLEECVGGTDPRDSKSRPELLPIVVEDTPGEMELSFQTLSGKNYTVSYTLDLGTFEAIPPGWPGDNKERILSIKNDGKAETTSPIWAQFWGNLPASAIDDLYNHSDFPQSPHGLSYLPSPQAPDFLAADYGARLSFWIRPDETGFHNFFLSSGGPAELYFGTERSELNKIAEVLPTQTGLTSGDWEIYDTQRSEQIELTAGQRYFLEVFYVSKVPRQHVEIAWSQPGINGISKLSNDDLAKVFFHAPTIPESSLLKHDYESTGETGTLWPANTEIEISSNPSMANFERVTGDPGNRSAESISLGAGSSEHLYATWLLNMATGHDDVSLLFMEGSDDSKQGPRINLEEVNSGTIATVRGGGSNGTTARIDIAFDQTFRVEIVATLSESGFEYSIPSGQLTVAEDTFDLYVSDAAGNLVGYARGLSFRDGAGVVDTFSTMRLAFATNPNIALDDWEITGGSIEGNGYLTPNRIDFGSPTAPRFFELMIQELDQDGDSLPDWEEIALASHYELLFFDAETNDGTPDANAVGTILADSQGEIEVALYGSDAAAFESNYPNTIPDDGEITITRTGSLAPVTVSLCIAPLDETGNTATVCDGTCCILIGSAGDEAAEREDYQLIEANGNIVTDSVHFGFGEMSKVLTLKAVDDNINEYPETVNLAIAESSEGDYTISETQNGASIQIFDLPDNPDNLTIFTGTFSQDGAAVLPTSGSGFISATLNGTRTELRIWNEFSGLTSAQQDAHVHKASAGQTPGPIIYEITETPGDPETDPLNGALVDYPWDISDSSGAVPTAGGPASKQVIIDSLFGQNGEAPLYLNVHTVDNPAGEIWAFFGLSGGSAEDPGDAAAAAAPGTAEYPQLTGMHLEAEVRRFLNQATFGAIDAEVDTLIQTIEQARLTDANYHRNAAFSDWIDNQINHLDQTYLLEYTLASHYQFMTLAHIFDPALNPSQGDWETPTKPTQWPVINRSDPNPEHWYLDNTYPVDRESLNLADANELRAEPNYIQRRQAHWQLMSNAHDQLRQKMGYALQQIVVVSDALTTVTNTPYGSANYQDMLNTYAFEHYRDVLGFVNWSPLMGKWLSSLQNQKAIDFDGDGLFDAFPDENLARENMQLFSIGLFDIWTDGSLKLSPEGLPRATYTNDDIREFAKILTGQSFSRYSRSNELWGGTPFIADNDNFGVNQNAFGLYGLSYLYPMKMFGDYHSTGAKTFAGVTIDNTDITDSTAQGIADIEDAIDWLAGKPGDGLPDYDMVNSHVSTPAFISRRLIQRFTTSNPSTEYLHRVATVFKNSEGDLAQTIRAILLDPEARNFDLNETTFGLKKSPLEGYLQLLRSLEAHTYVPIKDPAGAAPFDIAPGDFSNPELYLGSFGYPTTQIDNHERNFRFMPTSFENDGSRALQMNPFSQLTVFNFYLPDYSPGGAITNAGLVAPEMQLATEPDIIRNINYFEDITRSNLGQSGDELGGSDANQVIAFGNVDDADNNDSPRIARQALADAFYPSTEPTSQITTVANGTTQSIYGSNVLAPNWVRLSRTGDVFIASQSPDGVNWTEISTQVLPMATEVYIGLALTSRDDGILTTAMFSNVSLTGGAGTWYSSDVGGVAADGSTLATSVDSFELQGSGNDIWGTADEFHFAYQQLAGDGEIIARVDSLDVTNQWAKAGVMIRETLEGNSANMLTFVSASNGTRAQVRHVERGRSSESIADEALLDELDLRLTNGLFKMRYPYDTSDNDDPNVYGVDELLKNPREMIIDAITNAYGDPYDGSNDDSDRLNKFADALYLLTFSPEYQIKK